MSYSCVSTALLARTRNACCKRSVHKLSSCLNINLSPLREGTEKLLCLGAVLFLSLDLCIALLPQVIAARDGETATGDTAKSGQEKRNTILPQFIPITVLAVLSRMAQFERFAEVPWSVLSYSKLAVRNLCIQIAQSAFAGADA